MRGLRAWVLRLTGLFRKKRYDREFADEVESHLQMRTADKLLDGMSAQEARRQALLKLGGIEATKEIYRERRRLPCWKHCCRICDMPRAHCLKAQALRSLRC
jgi:macrolide transport system ATP-binding/permease protein